MTTGGFEVGADSVVAKLSVDVPAGSAETLHEINTQAEQLRVNLESVSRSTQSYLDYLREMPQLTEQAAQAQRNLITQLERTSYIQHEMGGLANVGAGPAQGATPYSTAAPAGYRDPFQGMTAGMRSGANQNVAGATSAMEQMMRQDPRMYANMLAQRGINPAQVGMLGTAASPSGGGGAGQGAGTPSSMSPQVTQASRDSSSPPDPNQSGQSMKSEPQTDAAPPTSDSPAWQQAKQQLQNMGRSVMNENKTRGGSLLGVGASMAGGYLANRFGGGGGGGGGGDGTGLGEPGEEGGGGMPRWLKGAGIGALALGANKMFQGGGEQIQKYRNLGAETGGGAIEGAGYEMQARTLALNPFLTLEQSRSIMQQGLRSGYTGKEFETVTHMMAENLKDMNMSASDSMQLFTNSVTIGGQSVKDFEQQMKDLKAYSATGYVRGEEKIAQNIETSTLTANLGYTGAAAQNLNRTMTEGYATNPILAKAMPGALGGAEQNDVFLAEQAKAAGIGGALPMEVAFKLNDNPELAGKSQTQVIKSMAQRAFNSSGGDEAKGAALFGYLLKQMGMEMTPNEYRELYRDTLSGGDAYQRGKQREADARKPGPGIASRIGGAVGGVVNRAKQLFGIGGGERMEDQSSNENMGNAPRVDPNNNAFTSQGQPRPSIPNTVAEAQSSRPQITTKGEVTGEVRIVVDQQGRVSAPQKVQLSGSQTAVNHGYGGGTLNNAPPGDSNYQHSNTGMG